MGTFAMWLEAKNNGLHENQIDDNRLVAMLNESYRHNRKLIQRIVESQDADALSQELKAASPSVWSRVAKLGAPAIAAALVALGTVGGEAINNSGLADAFIKSHRLENKHRRAVAGLKGMEDRMNAADAAKAAAEAAEQAKILRGRQSQMGGLPPDQDWRDLQRRHASGAENYGFGYTDSGSNPVPR